jgi:hypothetical protein
MSVDDRQDSSKISSSTLEDPQEINQTLVQLGRLGEAISKEYTLVSDRMTWLVISNSFMFGSPAEFVGKNSLVWVTKLMEFLRKPRFRNVKSTWHSHGQFCTA